jgi:hypothetical protein
MTRASIALLLLAALLGAPGASAAPASPAGPAAAPAPAAAPRDANDDLRAKELFQAQRYAEAAAIYAKRRAETGHPTYLRNLGRCHQMLRQPGPAISQFQAYLREAPDLAPAERAEIEGYIGEMERLRAETAAARPPSAAPAGAPSPTAAPPAPAPVWAPRAAASSPPPAAETTATSARDESRPRRWPLWVGIGGAVAVAAIVTVLLVSAGGEERLPCPPPAVCGP